MYPCDDEGGGQPELAPLSRLKISLLSQTWRIACMMHVYLLQVDDLDLAGIGPDFEKHPVFPAKINTEFVEVCQAPFCLCGTCNRKLQPSYEVHC